MNGATSAVPREIEALGSKYRSAASEATREILAEGRSPAKIRELAAVTADYSDREMRDWGDHPASPRGIACRSGCSSCCSALIVTTIPDVVRVAAEVLDEWPDEEFDSLRDRIDRHEEAHRGLPIADRRRLGHPCPLLDAAGVCSVHPIRPLICRGWNSLDVGRCVAFAADPRSGVEIPTDPVQRTIAGSIASGMAAGLAAEGLEAGAVELVATLRIILDDPESVDRWLAGEASFREAEVGPEEPEVHSVGIEAPG